MVLFLYLVRISDDWLFSVVIFVRDFHVDGLGDMLVSFIDSETADFLFGGAYSAIKIDTVILSN